MIEKGTRVKEISCGLGEGTVDKVFIQDNAFLGKVTMAAVRFDCDPEGTHRNIIKDRLIEVLPGTEEKTEAEETKEPAMEKPESPKPKKASKKK